MRVRVYRNLNNKMLSVLGSDRRVYCYATAVCLSNVKFIVLPGGKRRAIDSGIRNVHAFVEGDIVGLTGFKSKNGSTPPTVSNYSSTWSEGEVHSLTYFPFSELGFVDGHGFEFREASAAFIGCTGTIMVKL